MPDRTHQPPVRDFQEFSLKLPQRRSLANGIVLNFFENRSLDLIHLCVRIKAGLLYEPQKRVAAFTYELLKESHPTMTADELDGFFDYYGTSITAACSFGFANINIQVPKKNFDKVIPVLAELLMNPRFRPDNVERYRLKSILDFEYYFEKTDYRASQLMLNACFGKDFPYGKILERSDIESVSIEHMERFHQRTCCARNIRLFVTGNLSDGEMLLLSDTFGKIREGEAMPPLPDAAPHFTPHRIHEQRDSALQTSLVLCRPSLHYLDPDTHGYRFLITLFCNYFGSRLMQNLRERNGCTYGVSGSTSYYEAGAFLSMECEVNNDKVELALKECFREMERICEEPVGEEELDIVKNYLVGSSLRTVDGTVALMQAYMVWDDFCCGTSRFNAFLDAVKGISSTQVREMAQRLLRPDAFTVITIGNL
jgi:predicted Zn-dependent peptidase